MHFTKIILSIYLSIIWLNCYSQSDGICIYFKNKTHFLPLIKSEIDSLRFPNSEDIRFDYVQCLNTILNTDTNQATIRKAIHVVSNIDLEQNSNIEIKAEKDSLLKYLLNFKYFLLIEINNLPDNAFEYQFYLYEMADTQTSKLSRYIMPELVSIRKVKMYSFTIYPTSSKIPQTFRQAIFTIFNESNAPPELVAKCNGHILSEDSIFLLAENETIFLDLSLIHI